ncbi:conserved Plasmodium protein, unknown function [Plasmodium gallinaceum]|uniref:Uncharacterized protein n=1 Tax=Plasmodium gallinaceum TaxID=5849 RepID=A0A1J1H076_PLAGA|nr:conserved Plasmodium protein, unknown function [Plasmodium gallinaceum]CRG97850.1 conserved Plasmodium protein, unknown function [Plasmodium gallinaceum]
MNFTLCILFIFSVYFFFFINKFSGANFTSVKPIFNKIMIEENNWKNNKDNNVCSNKLILKIIRSEIGYNEFPSKSLLMTSRLNNIKRLFDDFSKDKNLSKMIEDCGNYVYLKYVKTIIFNLNENVQILNLKKFLQLLINKDVCIEFNSDVVQFVD